MTVGNVTFHLGTHPSEQRVIDYRHDTDTLLRLRAINRALWTDHPRRPNCIGGLSGGMSLSKGPTNAK